MFCPNCGANIPKSNPRFCPSCGAALDKDETQVSGTQAEVEAEAAQAQAPEPAPGAGTTAEPAPKLEPATGPMAEVEAQPKPEPVPKPAAESKSKPNAKIIALIAVAALVVAAVVVGVVVTTSSNNAGSSSQQPAPPENPPEPELSPEEKRAFFVGTWVAQDSTDKNMPKQWFDSNADQGIYITLILWDDGTGVFRTDSGPVKVTWDAESVTNAKMKVSDAEVSLSLRSKKLTMTNADGVEMYFVPEDEVDMSNAVDLTNQGQGVTVDPSTIKVEQYLKLIGNESVGYMQVPESWTNRTSDLDAQIIKSYDAIMYVNPRSEYLSPSLEHAAFSQMIQMSRYSVPYTQLAQQLADAYKADKNYTNTTTSRMTVGKRRAIYVSSSNTSDNVSVASVVIDRDNDEKVSVVLSLNCGAIGDQKIADQIAAFMSTWQVE